MKRAYLFFFLVLHSSLSAFMSLHAMPGRGNDTYAVYMKESSGQVSPRHRFFTAWFGSSEKKASSALSNSRPRETHFEEKSKPSLFSSLLFWRKESSRNAQDNQARSSSAKAYSSGKASFYGEERPYVNPYARPSTRSSRDDKDRPPLILVLLVFFAWGYYNYQALTNPVHSPKSPAIPSANPYEIHAAAPLSPYNPSSPTPVMAQTMQGYATSLMMESADLVTRYLQSKVPVIQGKAQAFASLLIDKLNTALELRKLLDLPYNVCANSQFLEDTLQGYHPADGSVMCVYGKKSTGVPYLIGCGDIDEAGVQEVAQGCQSVKIRHVPKSAVDRITEIVAVEGDGRVWISKLPFRPQRTATKKATKTDLHTQTSLRQTTTRTRQTDTETRVKTRTGSVEPYNYGSPPKWMLWANYNGPMAGVYVAPIDENFTPGLERKLGGPIPASTYGLYANVENCRLYGAGDNGVWTGLFDDCENPTGLQNVTILIRGTKRSVFVTKNEIFWTEVSTTVQSSPFNPRSPVALTGTPATMQGAQDFFIDERNGWFYHTGDNAAVSNIVSACKIDTLLKHISNCTQIMVGIPSVAYSGVQVIGDDIFLRRKTSPYAIVKGKINPEFPTEIIELKDYFLSTELGSLGLFIFG